MTGSISRYLTSQNVTWRACLLYLVVGAGVYLVTPHIMRLFVKGRLVKKEYLAVAAIVFVLSLFLPSPLIHGQNTNFTTHFVGGGIFTGLIWLFLKSNLGWKMNWLLELITLYFLVCGLGVANELFEFFANGLGILHIPSWDTWWDLFANVCGSLAFWIFYKIASR